MYLLKKPINVCWNPHNRDHFFKTINLRCHMPRFTQKMQVFLSISWQKCHSWPLHVRSNVKLPFLTTTCQWKYKIVILDHWMSLDMCNCHSWPQNVSRHMKCHPWPLDDSRCRCKIHLVTFLYIFLLLDCFKWALIHHIEKWRVHSELCQFQSRGVYRKIHLLSFLYIFLLVDCFKWALITGTVFLRWSIWGVTYLGLL